MGVECEATAELEVEVGKWSVFVSRSCCSLERDNRGTETLKTEIPPLIGIHTGKKPHLSFHSSSSGH